MPGLVAGRASVTESLPVRTAFVLGRWWGARMPTYSSREAIKSAAQRILNDLGPLVGEWNDATRVLYAAWGREDFAEALARYEQVRGRLFAAWQRAGGDVSQLVR